MECGMSPKLYPTCWEGVALELCECECNYFSITNDGNTKTIIMTKEAV